VRRTGQKSSIDYYCLYVMDEIIFIFIYDFFNNDKLKIKASESGHVSETQR